MYGKELSGGLGTPVESGRDRVKIRRECRFYVRTGREKAYCEENGSEGLCVRTRGLNK